MFQKIKKMKKQKVNDQIQAHQPVEETEPDSYDGYYDDILPPDLDRVGESIDKSLIRRIAAVGISLILIVSLCVLMLYML